MKCFVAMAFSRPDTDAVFERSICRVLAEQGVRVVRIDKLEHNDNIDDRIVSEIETADFAIADLTYSRPSVYYEAGYAERTIPVIYTIRRDHFKPRAEDEFGIFRIHFDLSMRNVIDWAEPDDEVFRERLNSRVELVMRPLLARDQSHRERAEAEARFITLPVASRRNSVREAGAKLLAQLGFLDPTAEKSKVDMGGWWRRPLYFKAEDGTLHLFDLTFNDEEHYYWLGGYRPGYNLNLAGNAGLLSRIEEHVVILSFVQLRLDDVANRHSHFEVDVDRAMLAETATVKIPSVPRDFQGTLVLTDKILRNSAGEAVKRFFQSLPPDHVWGILTDQPQPAMIHGPKDYNGYFIHEGLSYKDVKRISRIHLLDNIRSEADFTARFSAMLGIGSLAEGGRDVRGFPV